MFSDKAGPVLDLYHRTWNGKPLRSDDYAISTDEKTSIQAYSSNDTSESWRAGCVEHEYKRCSALINLAAWDVSRAKVFGLCQDKTGIEPFHYLVDLVMKQEQYKSARRVFWITDNDSSH